MNVRTVLVCAALMPLVLPAADYTLKSAPQSLADWRSGSFYEGEEAPPEDYSATIIIPEGLECLVNDDAMAFANGIRWFQTAGATSVIVFDVSTNSELMASVAANRKWQDAGVLRKQGTGQLTLTSTGRDTSYGDYWVDLEVRTGGLRLEEGVYYGGWDIAEGAEVIMVGGTSTERTFYIYSPKGLTGKGIVTNCTDVAGKCVLSFNSSPDVAPVFAGRILGKVGLTSRGNQDLTGTGSTIESVITRDGGMLGLSVIGRKGDPDSTFGTLADTLMCRVQTPGSYRYVGQGETTDRAIQFGGYDNKGRAGFDAGAYGGVTFEGSFLMGYANVVDRFWLDGSNVAPCYVTGKWYDYSKKTGKTYLTKRGSGTWRFSDYTGTDRSGLGAGFWIQNGTLGFETFNETNAVGAIGNPCSFFIGDSFAEDVASAPKLPYCFRLGDTNDLSATGLLEYYGTKRAVSRTRPVVVDGVGGLLSGANGAFFAEESGVSALTDKATFVLDGEADGQDLVKGLSDGEGKLSVEKRGSGTWTIAGTNNTFTGDIAVKGGTLVLRGVSGKFTWFRFTAPIPTSYYFDLVQFGLFRQDGTHLNPNLKLVPDAATSDGKTSTINPSLYGRIAPGECCLGAEFNNGQSFADASNSHLEHLFDCQETRCYCMNYKPGGDYSMVFRLPRSTDVASTWDFATIQYTLASQPIPDWLQMEGSVDGETWYVADRIDGTDVGAAGGFRCWRFNGVFVSDSVGKTPQVKITNGRPLVGYTNETVVVYSNPVSVANGATIEAEGLVKLTSFKVDGSAVAGTVKGFQLADDLTIDVCNMPRDRRIELPIDFEDVSGLSDPENWTIKENGKVTGKFSASVKDGKIVFERAGMTVIIK